MTKNWYPVVNYTLCEECGTWVNNCLHIVYDKEKSLYTIVVKTDDYIDDYNGCGNCCPVGVITYAGDDTGWTPPNGKKEEDSCGYNCNGGGCCE